MIATEDAAEGRPSKIPSCTDSFGILKSKSSHIWLARCYKQAEKDKAEIDLILNLLAACTCWLAKSGVAVPTLFANIMCAATCRFRCCPHGISDGSCSTPVGRPPSETPETKEVAALTLATSACNRENTFAQLARDDGMMGINAEF